MVYYIYVIKSGKDGSLYKGITNNLDCRLKQHNAGKNKSTKSKGPYRLVYFEELVNRNEARAREKYYKSGIGREKLKNLIQHSSVAQR